MKLISELRRRNVFRMAVLYLVAAWLVMQVAEVLIGLANLPSWIGPAILAILALGLPIALVFSWIYEITPEGITLEKNVEPGESITHLTGRRMDFIVIAVLSAALLVFAWDKWRIHEAPKHSIAVLPFQFQGSEAEDVEILAVGIQDGLLTKLSQIGSLKVISRTSADRYKESQKSVKQIAAELGVRALVEGSVQRLDDHIRVNVQLIDAEIDEHMWADYFDRSLSVSSIFAIQTEIVETIAKQLNTRLAPAERDLSDPMPTQNLLGYTEYLRGMKNADIESVESLNAAVQDFKRAIELDSDFALAHVKLADAYLTLGAHFFGGLSIEESVALAEPHVMRALSLNPGLIEAQASLGMLRQLQGNASAAEQAFEKAITQRPNYSRVFRLLGRLRWGQGRLEEALTYLKKALVLDPFSVPVNSDMARIEEEMGRFEDALERYLQVVEIEPAHAFAYVYIAAIHYLVFGQVDEALVWYNLAAEADPSSPSLQAAQTLAYLELGYPDDARQWVDRGRELGPNTFWALWSGALLNLYIGADDEAVSYARTLLQQYPRNWGALRILRDADLENGRLHAARSRYARAFRELVDPEYPSVTESNYFAAIDFALVLMMLGERDRANDILEGATEVLGTRPRLGTNGYWVSDSRIYAVQGQTDKALQALRLAVDSGWRFHTWYHLDMDPNLESIRATPEFVRIAGIVRADLEGQAKRVKELQESGELAPYQPKNDIDKHVR